MSDHPSPSFPQDHQQGCVQRYESMLSQGTKSYFDVEDLELVIDHYLHENDARRAKEALDFAKAQHPGSVELMYSEAVVLMNLGRLNRALEVLDALGKLEPWSAEVHLHKGSIHSQLRNYRRAIEHYRTALELAEEGHDEILLDIAERGRSLGVSLFGAQQTASEVERRVVAKAALRVVGQILLAVGSTLAVGGLASFLVGNVELRLLGYIITDEAGRVVWTVVNALLAGVGFGVWRYSRAMATRS